MNHNLDLPPELAVALEATVREIVRIADPELVILFGSWAEGKADADSDIDLMVVAETDERARLAARLRMALADVITQRDFDLIVVRAQDWSEARTIRGFITYEADRHGVRLYERAA